jgi:hypothetical protein
MNPGPAPTLVADWTTWPFVAAVVLTFAVWFAVYVIRAIKEDRLNDAYPDTSHDEPHECTIGGCHRPATHAFPTGITDVPYYACTGHTPTVRQWAGPYDVPYDQQLDGTDLALWEKEL